MYDCTSGFNSAARTTSSKTFPATHHRHTSPVGLLPPCGEHWPLHEKCCNNVCINLYLQSEQWVATDSVPVSPCRIAGILSSWLGCDGAAHTEWTPAPEPTNTLSRKRWHCHLTRYAKHLHTPPPGRISTHTTLTHTRTAQHRWSEKKKRKLEVKQMCQTAVILTTSK